MNKQSFENHVRIHPVYHYVLVPVSLILIILAGSNTFFNFSFGAVILLITTIMLHIIIFLARDYAKKNQDRIIRCELRLRYFQLTGNRLDELEDKFNLSQLLSLRFASDRELLAMLHKPETQIKPSRQIKKEISNWNPDHMRI